jgi:hypothetical protein
MSQLPLDADKLRAKRQALADQKRNSELRQSVAPGLVAVVNRALGCSLSLGDFAALEAPVADFIWPPQIEDAPGLVAAYVDRPAADRILSCVEHLLGKLVGGVGFHDKAYLGFARVQGVAAASLAAIAFEAKDSVLFFVDQPAGIVLVDYYESSQGRPYCVVIQGAQLIAETSSCFGQGDAPL